MLILDQFSYNHPNGDVQFQHLTFSLDKLHKTGLVGRNGCGKSTLFKIITGQLQATSGDVQLDDNWWLVPQDMSGFDSSTVAAVLQVSDKIQALRQILAGDGDESDFLLLNDDWTLEDRVREALKFWGLDTIDIMQPFVDLSGGQKTRVFLAGITIHKPSLILLDEPTNHLDSHGRQLFYDFIVKEPAGVLAISHDRVFLNLLDQIVELNRQGLTVYGGNYDFYRAQKEIADQASIEKLHAEEKSLKKARDKQRENAERQQRLDNRGRSKQEKAGTPRIMLNTLKNAAENSTSRLKDVHASRIQDLSKSVSDLRASQPLKNQMKFDFEDSLQHTGKLLVDAQQLTFSYKDVQLWSAPLTFRLHSGERVALTGTNGSGKTTLIRILLDQLKPGGGHLVSHIKNAVYIDQNYSLLAGHQTVYEQAHAFNTSGLQEHELKIRLNRFLFGPTAWNEKCSSLSGGEKMKLSLCCLNIANKSPDLIILDEPTNNLDIQSLEIVTEVINDYRGTLLVVSHDARFLEEVGIERRILLSS